ncbi:VOC family protein [Qipengyuania sp. DGS5-3]|uniref:VOC family protein n=1 Tax=Qipengyuania sp. DGS5-3 TaxID=3349632 RepID=UPI0036D2E69C
MLCGLDHFNISTADMSETLSFFEDMFDMRAEAAPGQDPAKNSWLFDQAGNALVHVNLRKPSEGQGPIHHAAFACQGYEAMRERLSAAGHKLTELDNRKVSGVRQIFLHSPEGALIELNFRGE